MEKRYVYLKNFEPDWDSMEMTPLRHLLTNGRYASLYDDWDLNFNVAWEVGAFCSICSINEEPTDENLDEWWDEFQEHLMDKFRLYASFEIIRVTEEELLQSIFETEKPHTYQLEPMRFTSSTIDKVLWKVRLEPEAYLIVDSEAA